MSQTLVAIPIGRICTLSPQEAGSEPRRRRSERLSTATRAVLERGDDRRDHRWDLDESLFVLSALILAILVLTDPTHPRVDLVPKSVEQRLARV